MARKKFTPEIGYSFHGWVVLDNEAPIKNGHHYTWLCQCKCGKISYLRSEVIKNASSTQCNKCAAKDRDMASVAAKHGKSRTPTYVIWQAMKQRCYNPSNRNYPKYGGRGIRVCERWHTFENFLADMGDVPSGLSLDREDNDGDYSPSNCRWVDRITQANNTRRNHRLTVDGIYASIAEHSRRYNIDPKVVGTRYLQHGWPIERALSVPTRKRLSTSGGIGAPVKFPEDS